MHTPPQRSGLPAEAQCAKAGYVALLSVLLVAALSASTVLILFITSLNTTLSSSDVSRGKTSKATVEACAELALQRLASGLANPCSTCPVSYALSQGNCTVHSILNSSGNTWRIRVSGSGSMSTITKYLEIDAVRVVASPVGISAWRECLDFSSSPCPIP